MTTDQEAPAPVARTRSDPWKVAFVALLVVSLVCVVTWVLLGSRLLVVRGVAVTGLDRVSSEEVVAAVDVSTGTPLIRVDLDRSAARAESLDLVESATVTRGWPATLRVEVVERRPLLAIRVGEEYRLVDGDGVRIEDSSTRPGTHPLVRVTGEIEGSDAVRAAAAIVEQAPDSLLAQIQLIDATDTEAISVELGNGALVEWGDPERTRDKSEILRVLMREHPPTEDRVYDVGTPDLAIVR
ncbi:cell division protein FtsQ/DivIB [Nocardiopsis sp. NRRL B-16309]|uniref:cell division protein FtsQ/DivIB n=1 Tax=Nocardiopsis sp. NRRL B-16309 TaxID=1519494 RepID=UPI0006AFF5DD|nr:FtsQ-type POTRA domain-containing protein [Nocardiopsis sp. NRRL B-16309]KOX07271.1 cell division protein FtsQ [Nocardiopsis sp. NRRL B-16309]